MQFVWVALQKYIIARMEYLWQLHTLFYNNTRKTNTVHLFNVKIINKLVS